MSVFSLQVLFLVLTVVYPGTMAQTEYPAENFPYFFQIHSVDVPDLDKYDFSSNTCKKCPRVFLPVCGDDNRTYTNECKMACTNHIEKRVPPVNMTRTGPCNIFQVN